MKLFIKLINFNPEHISHFETIKQVHNSTQKTTVPIIKLSVPRISTTDELMELVSQKLSVKQKDVTIKLVFKHQTCYKKVILVKGFKIDLYTRSYIHVKNTLQYQLELQVTLLTPKMSKDQLTETASTSIEGSMKTQQQPDDDFTRTNKLLFELMRTDQLNEFSSMLQIFAKKHTRSELSTLLNLYHEDTGYTFVHFAIIWCKHQFLKLLLEKYANLVDLNCKSIDQWLPIQLALKSQFKKAMFLFIDFAESINLDFSVTTEEGTAVYNLIDTVSIDLIVKVIKKFPIKFEDRHPKLKINVYDYVWSHKRYSESQKKQLIALMHQRHLQEWDYYSFNQILYNSCKKYIPSASNAASSPRKQIIYNPNLKIISGQIVKCKTMSSRYVFLSANSYIGAVEEYEINNKIKLSNDKQKLELYKKQEHISFEQIVSVNMLDKKDRPWSVKKQYYNFVIKDKRGTKIIYSCHHQYTATQWIEQIKQGIQAWKKNQEKHQKISKNYAHISDIEYKPPQAQPVKRMETFKILELFSSRLSICDPEVPSHSKSIEQMQVAKSKSTCTIIEKSASDIPIGVSSFKYKDFTLIQHLGEGSFGQVFLAECAKNKKLYALKVFQKKKIILSKQTKFVIAQVNILKQVNNPFIISLYFTFQTPNYIYLGLQYCEGKDLAKHLNQEMTFPQEDVRLYAAEIIIALEYIHSMGIIYRDLKPDNIMLGRDGHVLLVDFGLSKKTQNNFAKTFCGSPAYLSPEMLEKHGVGPQSDYFTLGVVIYEFLFGEPPFFTDNIIKLYENIQTGKVKFPRKIDDKVQNFLTSLLQKDPQKRLGSRSIEDIKNHEYFSGLDWQKVYKKQYKGPDRQLLNSHQTESRIQQKELVDMVHDDFDYSQENNKINRFRNFSFIREEEFK